MIASFFPAVSSRKDSVINVVIMGKAKDMKHKMFQRLELDSSIVSAQDFWRAYAGGKKLHRQFESKKLLAN